MAYGDPPDGSGNFLGMSPEVARNLTLFGSAMALGANQRTGNGLLAAGTGIGGPIAAGVAGAYQGNQNYARLASDMALQGAQTQHALIENQLQGLQIPYQRALMEQNLKLLDPAEMQRYLQQYGLGGGAALPQVQSPGGFGGGSSGPYTGGAANVPSDVEGAVTGIEKPASGKSAFNSAGYVGNYQFGTAALQSAGLYQPAQDEDLTKNQWKGQITVPGFDPMTAQEFAANPQAQHVAFQYHMGNLAQEAQTRGLTQYYGQTIGGVPINQATLASMMHFAGPAGTQQFLQSGGQYNPKDSNGTTIAGYAGRVQSQIASGSAPRPAAQAAQATSSGGAPSVATGAFDPRNVAGTNGASYFGSHAEGETFTKDGQSYQAHGGQIFRVPGGAPAGTPTAAATPPGIAARNPGAYNVATAGAVPPPPSDATAAPAPPAAPQPSGAGLQMQMPGSQTAAPTLGAGASLPQTAQAGQSIQLQPPALPAAPQPAPGFGSQAGAAPTMLPPIPRAAPDPALMAQANSLLQQAGVIEQLQKRGIMVPGDPAGLRAQALQFQQAALAVGTSQAQEAARQQLQMQYAGPTEAAKRAAGLPFVGPEEAAKAANAITTDRFGNMYRGGVLIGRGSEVKPVLGADGNYHWGDVGGFGVGAPENVQGGLGPGGTSGSGGISSPGPGQQKMAEVPAGVVGEQAKHDRDQVEGDLAHVIDNAQPAQQVLRQLRNLTPQAATGALAPLRLELKNFVQTFAPDLASSLDFDASPAQQFQKLSLLGAGRQERGDVGARGGFRLTELYLKANPNLDNQPDANTRMANALLIAHQYHVDYTSGATSFYNQNYDKLVGGDPKAYTPLSRYDNAFINTMRPEVYVAAIDALNGEPYQKWANGLTPKQLQLVGGILQRVDQSARVNVAGQPRSVMDFKTVTSPADIQPAGSSNASR
jgi:hypothetical protein